MEVVPDLSSNVIFKITSHRSYEHDDDVIYYDDPLQIFHEKSGCFTNFVENQWIYLDVEHDDVALPEDHEFIPLLQQRPSIKKSNDKRVPVVNENKDKCYWKFIQHCSYEEYN